MAQPCFVTFSKSNAKALLTADGHQKCRPAKKGKPVFTGFALFEEQGTSFEKIPLHPVQTVSVSMYDDGDDVLYTGRGIKIIVTVDTLCHVQVAFFPKGNLSAGVSATGMKVDTVITKQPSGVVM